MSDTRPIGMFDSGIGGLTVLREIRRIMPEEPIIYLGDTARVPYGTKSRETVVRYSLNNAKFLVENGVKMIVVACNTASSYALPELSAAFDVPVIGVVEGGVAAAVKDSSGRIGVIGTEATVRSGAYHDEIKRLLPGASVLSKPCPLFVALVEEGWTENDVAHAVAAEYLAEFDGKVDTMVLACTHYPLLKKTIKDTLGGGVRLIDSAEETARLVAEKMRARGMEAGAGGHDGVRFIVTDSPERSLAIGKRMLGDNIRIDSVELVDIS